MDELANVAIHTTQFPEAIRLELLESLRSRRVNHKFHYDSLKQTQKWLALHQAYSPARTDPHCAEVYRQSFAATVRRLKPGPVHVIGLGCGGGQKDAALLALLRDCGREIFYTPADVSVAMVLVARQAAQAAAPGVSCFPLVCDLATAKDLGSVLAALDQRESSRSSRQPPEQLETTRLLTFFGMIPNFEPGMILPKLASAVQPGHLLLLSANLGPGGDYATGVERVLPLYDNSLTRDWLMTFLLDLGVERSDGRLSFVIEELSIPTQLRRIVAYFHFTRSRTILLDTERFDFAAGESIRLFFSYRHTPTLVRTMLGQYGLKVQDQWITPSQEEGVFLVSRTD